MSTEQEEKLLFKHPAYFIAFGCGSGFSRYAPGTVSTLWAWAFFLVFDTLFTFNFWIFLLLISFALGIWASSYTTKKLNKNDPSEIVIDEIVSFWVILVLLPSTSDPMGEVILSGFPEWLLQSLSFILFRIFDILKPTPINWLDKNVKGGFGIMLDDLVAAGFTLITISIFLKLFPMFT